jgi:hypothetical protein
MREGATVAAHEKRPGLMPDKARRASPALAARPATAEPPPPMSIELFRQGGMSAPCSRALATRAATPCSPHAAPMVGAAVGEFIDWVEQLECGIDLFGAANYGVPG